MPELPEVECIRRDLADTLIGCAIDRATLRRRDVLRIAPNLRGQRRRHGCDAALLVGSTITELDRHGKQLAIIADTGRVLCVHLGMSGQLIWQPAPSDTTIPARTVASNGFAADHIHCTWRATNSTTGTSAGRLHFRDPRRFGGLWSFATRDDLDTARWDRLGPDALGLTPADLAEHLARSASGSTRSIKSLLLDQHVIAGVGNIYADEALFAARIDPRSTAGSIDRQSLRRLSQAVRAVLDRAIRHGGSTQRDYRRPNGRNGTFQQRHQVYGRAGQPCVRCGSSLRHWRDGRVSQRSTVGCLSCQHLHE